MISCLFAHKDEGILLETYGLQCLGFAELIIVPENMQRHPSFQYLGHMSHHRELKPQKLEIMKDGLKTLNDFQKLLVNIKWLRLYFKYPKGDLEPLSKFLKGNSDSNFGSQLTETCQTCTLPGRVCYTETTNILY